MVLGKDWAGIVSKPIQFSWQIPSLDECTSSILLLIPQRRAAVKREEVVLGNVAGCLDTNTKHTERPGRNKQCNLFTLFNNNTKSP